MPKLSIEYNLLILHSDMAKQWYSRKNGRLKPEDGTPKSKNVWWRCKDAYEWKVTVNNRILSRTGCPYYSGKRVSNEYTSR
jgi:hypothetical protein